MATLQCSCGNPAASACGKHLCGRCCLGCVKHPWKLPPLGEPGSCQCGQAASPACDNWLCASCCTGCSRHTVADDSDASCYSEEPILATTQPFYSEALQPGEPGSCGCGQTASPQCDNHLCASCCNGCSRHAYAGTESEAGPQPGEPGSCSCGQTASPQCDHLLCANCCNGCSRHGYEDSESEAGPSPGEPGSCSCGQTASPQCDNHLCASCCNGCSRHAYAGGADREESVQYQPEPQQQYAPEPQLLQHIPCDACMQYGSRQCSMLRCRTCCAQAPSGTICCPYHNHRVHVYEDYPDSEHSTDSIELRELFLGMGSPAQPQRQQPPRCMCGQAAALTCSMRCCASCCCDPACARHAASGLENMQEAGLMTAMSLSGLAQVLVGYGLHPLSRLGPAGVDPGVIGSAWQGLGTAVNPAGLRSQPAGASAAPGSSRAAAAARASDTAAGPDQRAAAAAGPSSSTAGGAHKAGMPVSEAEEALFQLKHCVVCLDEPRSVLLLPCKHLVLCGGCMAQMQRQVRQDYASGSSDETGVKCPVCREPAASMLPGVILS